jgi:benzoate-CoA ligase
MRASPTVDRTTSPPLITVPRDYNAAADFIDRHVAEGRGDRVAFEDDTRTVTYAELSGLVARAGNALSALGVAMEQRVLLLMMDSIEMVACFFGAIKIGAVPVPSNTWLTDRDYDYILRDSRAGVVVVSASMLEKVLPALAGQRFVRHVVVDGEAPGAPAPGTANLPMSRLDDLLAEAAPELEPAHTTRDDACFWLYTSGSTGQPKAAIHAHADMLYTAELYGVGVLGIRQDDVVFSAAKLFFAYGLGNAITFPLRVGARARLMAERPTTSAVIARLVPPHAASAPTIFCGVPTLYASLLADPQLPPGSALRLRACISAGEALPADVSRRWRAHTGVDILDGIGSTEMLHIFVSNRPGAVRDGTTGTVVPGYEAKIVGDDGETLPPGEVGDLVVSGPSSAAAYWNKRELSLRTFEGRWTRTGDRYLVTDDGYFVYQGRSDDMLKVGGIYVSPFEVEAALIAHASVLEAAVVGQRDEADLVKPKAYVVLAPGHSPSPAHADVLKAHVKSVLAVYKYPRWIEFVAELPKTATGKIQRFKLRAP